MSESMSKDMSERMSEDMSERMSKEMSERCQKEYRKICQKICQKECQKIYPKICQKECQKICQKELQKIASSQSAKLRVTERISGDELYVYPHLTRSGWHKWMWRENFVINKMETRWAQSMTFGFGFGVLKRRMLNRGRCITGVMWKWNFVRSCWCCCLRRGGGLDAETKRSSSTNWHHILSWIHAQTASLRELDDNPHLTSNFCGCHFPSTGSTHVTCRSLCPSLSRRTLHHPSAVRHVRPPGHRACVVAMRLLERSMLTLGMQIVGVFLVNIIIINDPSKYVW